MKAWRGENRSTVARYGSLAASTSNTVNVVKPPSRLAGSLVDELGGLFFVGFCQR